MIHFFKTHEFMLLYKMGKLALKFESNVRASLNPDQAREVAHTIFNFAEDKTSLADLASLLERV